MKAAAELYKCLLLTAIAGVLAAGFWMKKPPLRVHMAGGSVDVKGKVDIEYMPMVIIDDSDPLPVRITR